MTPEKAVVTLATSRTHGIDGENVIKGQLTTRS